MKLRVRFVTSQHGYGTYLAVQSASCSERNRYFDGLLRWLRDQKPLIGLPQGVSLFVRIQEN